ncbi:MULTISPECIES: MarR family winged helix-turn-helix transcriptional regulator [Lacticaseibacillus]|uniref:MarR family winged helix-turn-helix transcriptional regulator n=1 Tax=Lacticaseibacillus TaxID=2759736 RepID=UPI00063DCE21|nr:MULTISPECIES: MarR family transcriptional regulator [Lacticaseibacillus]KLI76015.1 MarR family transcriptional regulator [Lacticaseibacillus casei]
MSFDFTDRPDAHRLELMRKAYPDVDTQSVLTFLNFRACFRAVAADYQRVLDRFGLSESRFLILMFLYHNQPQALGITTLATKLGATKATTSKLVGGMVKSGLVEKVSTAADKRATLIQMTHAGAELLDRFLPVNYQAVNHLFRHLTHDEQVQLNHLLDKLLPDAQ